MKWKPDGLGMPVGCALNALSRRQFLAGCVACAGAAGLKGAPRWLRAAAWTPRFLQGKADALEQFLIAGVRV